MKKPIILIAAVAACRCRLGRWRQPTRQRRRSRLLRQRGHPPDLAGLRRQWPRAGTARRRGRPRAGRRRAGRAGHAHAGAAGRSRRGRRWTRSNRRCCACATARVPRNRPGAQPARRRAGRRGACPAGPGAAARHRRQHARARRQRPGHGPRPQRRAGGPGPGGRTARSAAPGRARPAQGRHRWRRGPVAGHAGSWRCCGTRSRKAN